MNARVARIRTVLEQAFDPIALSVQDDSHLHRGHEGARDGRGHFSVTIVATVFAGRSPVERHRMVYAALGDMLKTDIHALGIDAKSPDAG